MKRLSRLIVCVCMPVFSFWQLEAKVVTDSLTTKAMTASSVASMLRGEVVGVRVGDSPICAPGGSAFYYCV